MDPASHWLSATWASFPTGPEVHWDYKQTTTQSEKAEWEKSLDTDGPAQTYSVGEVLEWWHPGMHITIFV